MKRYGITFLLIASILAFAVSFILPAYQGHPDNPEDAFGYDCFVAVVAAFSNINSFWRFIEVVYFNLSNMVYLYVLISWTLGKRVFNPIIGFLGLASALYWIFTVFTDLMIGYYVWLFSQMLLTLLMFLTWRRR